MKRLNVTMCEGIDAELPTFLPSALYGDKWQVSSFVRFIPIIIT